MSGHKSSIGTTCFDKRSKHDDRCTSSANAQKKSGGLCSKLRIHIRILRVLFLRHGTL